MSSQPDKAARAGSYFPVSFQSWELPNVFPSCEPASPGTLSFESLLPLASANIAHAAALSLQSWYVHIKETFLSNNFTTLPHCSAKFTTC